MIILRNDLTKEDYEFASIDLKILLQNRDKKNFIGLNNESKGLKNFDKFIIPLAEQGQIEAIETYCKNLTPVSSFNSKIFTRIAHIEQKFVKEPREYSALAAYYKWHVDYCKFNFKDCNITQLESYKKWQEFFKKQFLTLKTLSEIDPIAQGEFFLLKNHNLINEEYLREISNIRNKIFEASNKQVNENKKLKLLYAYSRNLILYANDSEYKSRREIIDKTIIDIQKNYILANEIKKSF